MFAKLFLLALGALCISIVHASTSSSVEFRSKTYTYGEVVRELNSYFEGNALDMYKQYEKLYTYVDYHLDNTHEKKQTILEILELGKSNWMFELENITQEYIVGYSENGSPIMGYFRGNPEEAFNLIVGGIHGSYEYGTYETAKFLVEVAQNNKEKNWFIIPNANPDGMELYNTLGTQNSFYLTGRGNTHSVDLNRNFCTRNYIYTDFVKYGELFSTGRENCESESETRALLALLETFQFKNIISLHSQGAIFYIPDNSIDDSRVIDLGKSVQSILPDYEFYPDTSSQGTKQISIERYEMDEGGKGVFTGTFETYAYENYDVPTVLIELKNHGKREDRLEKIFSVLD